MNRAWILPLVAVLFTSTACTRDEGTASADTRPVDPAMKVDRTSASPEMRVDVKVVPDGSRGPLASYAQTLPEFTLNDPNNKPITKTDLAKDGLVLVVTAPILANQTAQEGWAKALQDTRGNSKVKFAYLQDMHPSNFKDTARSRMREEYAPERGPILILDETGAVRQQLQVKEEKTVVLVYDPAGKLIYVEDGDPSNDRAKMIWKRANGV